MILALVVGMYGWRRARGQTPLSITGPNILQNNDFGLNTDSNPQLPDGWTSAAPGVQLSEQTSYDGKGRAVQILGINNYLKSPLIAARPGTEYRVAFRALSDTSPTKVRVLFHWRDAEGIDRATEPQPWQSVPVMNWNTISAAGTAPPYATHLLISIQPAADVVVFIDDLSLGQLGVRVAPWPNGKPAALAFSFDYETAMGGLIHGKSVTDDPNAADDPLQRARRMRDGAEQTLALFAPTGIRASYYTNGYNFLTGNTERRQFMNNPVYPWANVEHGWKTNQWVTQPWFGNDPYTTEAEAREWYFGSQIKLLQAAKQDIQSHTFAHFAGTYVTPADWRADFAAWKDVADQHDVAPATSLAFPWSSSAGMTFENWDALVDGGIQSVTRTVWQPGQRRSWIADRQHYALRQLPGHNELTVIGDQLLTPKTRAAVLQHMQTARLNEGAIDVWAHTEEVTSPEQIAAWQAAIDVANRDFWIAPVPEIVQYAADIQRVTVEVAAEQPQYRFTVRNTSPRDLRGVTLTLPFVPQGITIDGNEVDATGTTLILDLKRGAWAEVVLSGTAATTHGSDLSSVEAAWQA